MSVPNAMELKKHLKFASIFHTVNIFIFALFLSANVQTLHYKTRLKLQITTNITYNDMNGVTILITLLIGLKVVSAKYL